MLEPKKIDEIIAEIMGETFAKIKFPDAKSITTSVEPKMVVDECGDLKRAIFVKVIVVPKADIKEIVISDFKILPSNQQQNEL